MTLRLIVFLAIWTALAAGQSAPKKLTQAEAMEAAVHKVQPEYPDLARQLKISGTVDLDVLISESGAVETVTPVTGNPVLTKTAAEAIRKWKFKPFQQDGNAVKAQVILRFGFRGSDKQ